MKKSVLIDATRQHDSYTFNGAVTHSTSLSECLDMFFLAGASRRMDADHIVQIFLAARAANPILAYKILFWARDCRGGAGERHFFHSIAQFMLSHREYRDEWEKVSVLIPEYGSWRDIFVTEKPNEDNLNWLSIQLEENPNSNLLAKWFPRKGPWFVAMHKYKKLTPKEFRKYLVSKTNVVEHLICRRLFSEVDYSKVPSVAMNKYRKMFMKWDEKRFQKFIDAVLAGTDKVNASVLFPYQLYQAIKKGEDALAVEAQWKALPNYMEGSEERILPICDVSGSMTWTGKNPEPIDISVSLGIYISERNEGIFKNAFLTFDDTPKMLYVQGNTLKERMRYVERAPWGGSTNLQASFDLILNAAVKHGIPESEMPTKLLIISDMEFNSCARGTTNFESIKAKYQAAGYKMPQIIFWNVNGRIGNVPVRAGEESVGLVSGFSPSILTAILQGEIRSPHQLMMDAVNTDRYKPVAQALA